MKEKSKKEKKKQKEAEKHQEKGGFQLMKRKVLSGVLAMAMVLGMTASVGSVQVKADDEITLKVFSNLPDRKNGQGLVEQEMITPQLSAMRSPAEISQMKISKKQ